MVSPQGFAAGITQSLSLLPDVKPCCSEPGSCGRLHEVLLTAAWRASVWSKYFEYSDNQKAKASLVLRQTMFLAAWARLKMIYPKGLLLISSGSLIHTSKVSVRFQVLGSMGAPNSWVAIHTPSPCNVALGIQWIQVGCRSQLKFPKDSGELHRS